MHRDRILAFLLSLLLLLWGGTRLYRYITAKPSAGISTRNPCPRCSLPYLVTPGYATECHRCRLRIALCVSCGRELVGPKAGFQDPDGFLLLCEEHYREECMFLGIELEPDRSQTP